MTDRTTAERVADVGVAIITGGVAVAFAVRAIWRAGARRRRAAAEDLDAAIYLASVAARPSSLREAGQEMHDAWTEATTGDSVEWH